MKNIGDAFLKKIQGDEKEVPFRLKGIRLFVFILLCLRIILFLTQRLVNGWEVKHLPFVIITVASLILSYILVRFFLNHKLATVLMVVVVSLLFDISFLFYPDSRGFQLIVYLFTASVFYLLSPKKTVFFVDFVTFFNVVVLIAIAMLDSGSNFIISISNGNIYYLLGVVLLLMVFFVFIRYYFKTLQKLVNNIQDLNSDLEIYKSDLEQNNIELSRLNSELLKEREKYAGELKMRKNFLSIMSHEIRTPLNAIVGFSEFIKDFNVPESEIRDSVKNIYFSSQHLLLLVNDILDFSRLDEKKLTLREKSFKFRRSLELIYAMYEKTAINNNLNLKFEIDERLGYENFIGDETRINQVLINLITNAFKFTDEGSVIFSCRIVETNNDSVSFVLSVEDTGVGISAEDQKLVFERFKQLDNGVSRKYQGSGLGLSISKSIVELFGSELKLESEPGKGSRFSFDLTLAKDLEENDEKEQDRFVNVLKGIEVLVADDNLINRKMLSKVMGRWGITTHEVEDGDVAVEFLQQRDCDIVMMDIHMPRLNGLLATEQIRKIRRNHISNIPVIALTADLEESTLEEINKSSINDYLSKPFDGEQLKRKLIKFVLLNLQNKAE